jgi:hypothetical protein
VANKYKHIARKLEKERRRERMCDRKVAWDTAEQAAEGTIQRVYLCPYCQKFHRTAQDQKLLAAIRRKKKKRP